MNKQITLDSNECFEAKVALAEHILSIERICNSTCNDAGDFKSLIRSISAYNKIWESEGYTPRLGPLSW